jgi:hypothetical protein
MILLGEDNFFMFGFRFDIGFVAEHLLRVKKMIDLSLLNFVPRKQEDE